jgi:DNA-binding beta-propeller fold protein YncE
MKKLRVLRILVSFALALAFLSAWAGRAYAHPEDAFVIANRASGSISVIGARSHKVLATIDLPSDGLNPPEPMYVVYSSPKQRVFVGDRANDRVVVFRASDFSVETTVPAGRGVFHMWASNRSGQLWVNNDVDNTATVIDVHSLEVLATVPTPADLVALGGRPHDVILDPTGPYAYVTVLGLPGPVDYVVKYSTIWFREVDRAAVGKDPHLLLTARNRMLYLPCQNSNAVYVLNRKTMEHVTVIDVPGAHGAGMTLSGETFYTTNLPGGGDDGLFAIDTATNTVVGAPVDTAYPVPHNIALTNGGRTLFVTHSGGTADKVTIYETYGDDPTPVHVGEVTVGLNPFGLDYVPSTRVG